MRKKIVGSALLLAGLAVVAWSLVHRGPSPVSDLGERVHRKPRSVLLITTDTTRADHLEPYGAENVRTPTLQRLANEGIVMEDAFAVAPLTLPAHTAILTGLYPPQSGVRNNGTHFVPAAVTTLAERLAGEGYRTAAFVSAAVLERRYGLDQGFEVYDDDLSKSRLRLPRMVADRPGEFTVAAARQWLDGLDDDEPFFLWVHFYDPHAAYNPPAPYRDEYRTHLYAGEIAYMDAQIGRLLEHPRLRRAGNSRGLAVAVIGDHGESLGEHGENTHGILPYRSTLHVPWILWLDDGPRGLRVPRHVSQVDLVPTLLDLLDLLPPGLAEDEHLAGRSLLAPPAPERPLYSESYLPFYTYGWAKLQVMRLGRWEYVDAPSPELYDLERDPRELTNLVARRDEITHDLRAALDAFHARYAPQGDREEELKIDQEALAKLRALGYVSMASSRPSAAGERPDPKTVIHLHTTLERARGFLNDGLYEQAANLLRGLLREDPKNVAAMADLSQALERLGRSDEAASVLGEALDLDPDNQQLLLMLAQTELARGRVEQAQGLTEHLLELNRTNMSAWAVAAQVQARLGDAEGVAATLESALEIDPRHPLINALYAQSVEIPAGRVDDAELRLRQATARDPFQVVPWRILGSLLEREGRLDEALAAYREGLEHTPDATSLHALLAVLLARRGDPDAEAHLREAIRHESEFRGELYVSLGALLAEKGRYDEAEKLYEQVLAIEPGNAAARNNRAIALARTGETERALAELRALTAEHPSYADAHNNLAVLLLRNGDYRGAERYARRTTVLAPAVSEAWDTLGAALLEQGRAPEAVAPLDRALELRPDSWSALLHRGLTRVALGDAAGARDDLTAALAGNSCLPAAYLALARLYDGELADPGRARRYYRTLLDRFPDDEHAAEVRARLSELPPPS